MIASMPIENPMTTRPNTAAGAVAAPTEATWTDTHCHLDARDFDVDRDSVVARARAAGLGQIVLPAVERSNFDTVRGLAHRYGFAYGLGIHPMCSGSASADDLLHLRGLLTQHLRGDSVDQRLVAIGEIGIDHFVPGLDPIRQVEIYIAQLKLAREFDLPVILHVRKSADTVLKHLRAIHVRGGIAHAFNGSEQQAMAFVDMGFKLGFGGAVTFDRALQIRRIAQAVPAHAIVMETDSPDIPPHWLYRTAQEREQGAQSRNEPAELPRIAQTMSELRGLPLAELAALTSANARDALPGLAALASLSS
jgi:TatD DNase family protein